MAKLLAGLYEPDAGDLRWDGSDVLTFPSRLSVRARIAVIFQDFVRYAFTRRGEHRNWPSRIEPLRSFRTRSAGQRICRPPTVSCPPYLLGYETPLSRLFAGGQELSGGQWQRVAIARAFYRNAPFVILDEPSAALDPRAEYELFSSLRQALAGRAALFISHRFSSVRSADRIYVLDKGKVIEHGSHEELLLRDAHYAELFRLQAAAYSVQD